MGESVVGRVRVNQTTDGTPLGGESRFDTTPAPTVAGNGDLAFHRDTQGVEHFIVCRQAVVDINHITCDIAVGGVSVVGGKHVLALRVRIGGKGRLSKLELVLLRAEERHLALLGSRKQDFIIV